MNWNFAASAIKVTLTVFLFVSTSAENWFCNTDDTPDQPVELGKVKWTFDLDSAQTESKRTGRPILLLFQEVPG